MYSVEINGNTVPEEAYDSAPRFSINTAASAPSEDQRSDPYATELPDVANSDYILVEAKNAALTAEQKDILKEKKVELLEYEGNNVYLCGYTPKTLDPVNDLDFVKRAVVYHPGYVIHPELKEGDVEETTDVVLTLHDDVDDNADALQDVVKQIASVTGISESDVDVSGGTAKINVPRSKLAKLAEIDQVKAISGYSEPQVFNNVAGRIMEVHKPTGLNNQVFKGKDQIVCVADTGFDKGSVTDAHPAFTGRVKQIQPFGNRLDQDGHGTHVSGSVLGKGTLDPKLQKFVDGQNIEAPASDAKLIVQALSTGWDPASVAANPTDMRRWRPNLSGIPARFMDLGNPAFREGARVHSNSWGGTRGAVSTYLTEPAGNMDDYLVSQPGLVVCFAASNDGVDVDANPGHIDPSSLSSQACAKNIITVGACESERKDVVYGDGRGGYGPRKWGDWGAKYPSAPIKDDPVANNSEGLAAFSSRGPAWLNSSRKLGRIKPDVVAPGTTILSARSRGMDPRHYSDSWGRCDDPAWRFSGGTSMATPLVAGCCAVIRGALVDKDTKKPPTAVIGGPKEPTAALVKAILINGASAMKGQYGQQVLLPNGEFGPDYDRPNNNYGFGRVNLNNSLQHVATGTKGVLSSFGDMVGNNRIGTDTGFRPTYSFNIIVPQSSVPQTLKVTLVYHDKGGAQLNSNLNLLVQGPTGAQKRGNMPDGSAVFDEFNNVEQVKWKSIPAGTYKVTIIAQRTLRPQAFAYAWRLYPST